MATFTATNETVEHNWFVVDVGGQVLGRVATKIATVLRGKHKAVYTPHIDTGDFVVVINADKVRLSGNKESDKVYYRHTGYPGGTVETAASDMRKNHPTRLVELAVRGMLPKGSLGRRQLKKLKVFAGADHSHAAQTPKPLSF